MSWLAQSRAAVRGVRHSLSPHAPRGKLSGPRSSIRRGRTVDRVRNNGEARQAGYSFPPWPVNPPRTLPHGVARRVPHLFTFST